VVEGEASRETVRDEQRTQAILLSSSSMWSGQSYVLIPILYTLVPAAVRLVAFG
jgi:hypothetical protein